MLHCTGPVLGLTSHMWGRCAGRLGLALQLRDQDSLCKTCGVGGWGKTQVADPVRLWRERGFAHKQCVSSLLCSTSSTPPRAYVCVGPIFASDTRCLHQRRPLTTRISNSPFPRVPHHVSLANSGPPFPRTFAPKLFPKKFWPRNSSANGEG